MALYDDFESGNLNKWDYWESNALCDAIVESGQCKQTGVYSQHSTLTSNGDVGDGTYSIEYKNTIPATNHFNELAIAFPDNTKNIYDNISEILWGKLIAIGSATGSYV